MKQYFKKHLKHSREITLSLCGSVITIMLVAAPISRAEPGDGIRLGEWQMSPFLDISGVYDSNAGLDDNETSDYYGELWGGVDFLRETDRLTLQGQLWGKLRRYEDMDQLDYEGVGENAGVRYRPFGDLELTLEQHYALLTDYEYTLEYSQSGLVSLQDRTERQEREIFSVAAGAEKSLSDKTHGTLNLGYGYADYDSSANYDSTESNVGLELAYDATDKTAIFAFGNYEILDSDGNDDPIDVYELRLGAKTRTTAKLTFRAGAGVMWYDVDDGGSSSNESAFNFNLMGAWQLTERLDLVASARNYLRVTVDAADNAKDANEFTLGGNYQYSDKISLSLTGGYAMNEYVNRVLSNGSLVTREQDIWMLRARCEYKPPIKLVSFYVDGEYNVVEDNVSDDYDQVRVGVGVKLRY